MTDRKIDSIKSASVWHTLFEAGLVLRLINGVLETLIGIFAFTAGRETINRFVIYFTRGELLEDPNDKLIGYLSGHFSTLPRGAIKFAALYILAHGILNIFLSVQLYRNRIWAYHITMMAMVFFMVYQIYRITHTHSITLSAITIFDGLFIILMWHEFRYHRKQA